MMKEYAIGFLLGLALVCAILAYSAQPRKSPRRRGPGTVNGEDHL